jgi:hypothetical protein
LIGIKMATASPKQKNPSWNEGDDLRLYKIFQTRKVNPKETPKKHIEPVRLEHFPQIPYRNFCVNFCKKSAQWETEQEKHGANRPGK